jgi:hypothetical protein
VPEYIRMTDIPQLLWERLGIRISYSTVAKWFSPRVGRGPKPAMYWSGRPYYSPDTVLEWARDRMTPTRDSAA